MRGTFENITSLLQAADAMPEHIVRMRIYVLDVDEYAANTKAIGALYREHFGRWFPAMALIGVARLFDPGALIEIEVEVVVPD